MLEKLDKRVNIWATSCKRNKSLPGKKSRSKKKKKEDRIKTCKNLKIMKTLVMNKSGVKD